MSFLRYGIHACIQHSECGLTIALYKGTYSCFLIWFPFQAATCYLHTKHLTITFHTHSPLGYTYLVDPYVTHTPLDAIYSENNCRYMYLPRSLLNQTIKNVSVVISVRTSQALLVATLVRRPRCLVYALYQARLGLTVDA